MFFGSRSLAYFLRRFTGGQRFGMGGSKLAVLFNYLNEIEANIIIYNQTNHTFFKKFRNYLSPGLFEMDG